MIHTITKTLIEFQIYCSAKPKNEHNFSSNLFILIALSPWGPRQMLYLIQISLKLPSFQNKILLDGNSYRASSYLIVTLAFNCQMLTAISSNDLSQWQFTEIYYRPSHFYWCWWERYKYHYQEFSINLYLYAMRQRQSGTICQKVECNLTFVHRVWLQTSSFLKMTSDILIFSVVFSSYFSSKGLHTKDADKIRLLTFIQEL